MQIFGALARRRKRTRAPMTTTYHLSFRYWFSPTQGYPRGRGESLFTALPAAATGDNPETEGRRAWLSVSCDFLRHPFAPVTLLRAPDERADQLSAALLGIPSRSSPSCEPPMRVPTSFLRLSSAFLRARHLPASPRCARHLTNFRNSDSLMRSKEAIWRTEAP